MTTKPRTCRLCKKQRALVNNRSRVCRGCFPEWRERTDSEAKHKQLRSQWHSLLSDQFGDACMICGRESMKRKMNVDHCHQTGSIRGLLCYFCNYGLSWFKDDAARLRAAIEYLENPPASGMAL